MFVAQTYLPSGDGIAIQPKSVLTNASLAEYGVSTEPRTCLVILTLILRHKAEADADALDGVYLARVRARVALHGFFVS